MATQGTPALCAAHAVIGSKSLTTKSYSWTGTECKSLRNLNGCKFNAVWMPSILPFLS